METSKRENKDSAKMETPTRNLQRNRRPTQKKIAADMQTIATPSRTRKPQVKTDSKPETQPIRFMSSTEINPIHQGTSSLAGPSNSTTTDTEMVDIDFAIHADADHKDSGDRNTSYESPNYKGRVNQDVALKSTLLREISTIYPSDTEENQVPDSLFEKLTLEEGKEPELY